MTLRAASAPPHQEAGFTLMELLVAIALLSLLSVVLVGSLRFSLTAWARGADHVERVEDTAIVQEFLRRTIGDAYPLFILSDPTRGVGYVDFTGTRQSLRFLADAPIALGGRGRVWFALALERQNGHAHFIITSTPELAAAASARKILLPDVEGIALDYFGIARADRQAAWHAVWRVEPVLPQLVRLKVSFASSDQRAWPDLVIAPRITADVGCVHDPLTKQCRGR
jgi:general secretion pathway protein J